LLKKSINILRGQKGVISIIFVILIMIAIVMVSGFKDLLFRDYFFRELQSIMEISQVSALRGGVTQNTPQDAIGDNVSSAVDDNWHRLESLVINEGRVSDLFEQFVLDSITVGGDSFIRDIDFKKTIVRHQYDNFGFDDGIAREYAYVDSTVGIKYENLIWDADPGATRTYHDAKAGNDFTITYMGATDDGLTEVLIRTVSRIILV